MRLYKYHQWYHVPSTVWMLFIYSWVTYHMKFACESRMPWVSCPELGRWTSQSSGCGMACFFGQAWWPQLPWTHSHWSILNLFSGHDTFLSKDVLGIQVSLSIFPSRIWIDRRRLVGQDSWSKRRWVSLGSKYAQRSCFHGIGMWLEAHVLDRNVEKSIDCLDSRMNPCESPPLAVQVLLRTSLGHWCFTNHDGRMWSIPGEAMLDHGPAVHILPNCQDKNSALLILAHQERIYLYWKECSQFNATFLLVG